MKRTAVTGPISYIGQKQLQRDLDNYKAGLEGLHFEDVFVPCATPACDDADPEHVYKNEDDYLAALADAMRVEYKAIVDAGFIVQLDLGTAGSQPGATRKPAPTWEELQRVFRAAGRSV